MAATGSYISDTDIYTMFGQSNITKWADVENTRQSVETRLQAAIDWAESQVQNVFRGSRVDVPFVLSSTDLNVIKSMMIVYAVYWLRMARPANPNETDYVSALKEAIDAQISDYIDGKNQFESAMTIDTAAIVGMV